MSCLRARRLLIEVLGAAIVRSSGDDLSGCSRFCLRWVETPLAGVLHC